MEIQNWMIWTYIISGVILLGFFVHGVYLHISLKKQIKEEGINPNRVGVLQDGPKVLSGLFLISFVPLFNTLFVIVGAINWLLHEDL